MKKEKKKKLLIRIYKLAFYESSIKFRTDILR